MVPACDVVVVMGVVDGVDAAVMVKAVCGCCLNGGAGVVVGDEGSGLWVGGCHNRWVMANTGMCSNAGTWECEHRRVEKANTSG